MRYLIFFFLSVISLATMAQQPDWYDDDQRDFHYPAKQYFTGFVEGQRANGEHLETATQRLKNAARVEAASTVRVFVKNTTTNTGLSQTLKTMEGTFRQTARQLESRTTTSVEMEIPSLQIEAWQNPSTGTIAAFAYVKKSTLIRQLEKKITVGLTKIETTLDQVDQLIATGQKMQARDLAQKTLPQFSEVDETQKLLAAVDENADEESLQLQETRTLQHRLTGLIANLKNGINVCLLCKATDFNGNRYSALQGEIKGALSSMGVSFVDNVSDADWVVSVSATPRQHNAMTTGQYTSYFVYVDADISVTKVATNQVIFEDRLSEKGGHTFGYAEAARDGYKYLSPRISEIIKQQIQQ